jgi:hypothetical protein
MVMIDPTQNPIMKVWKFPSVDCLHLVPRIDNIPPTYEPMTSHEPVKVLHTTI